MVFKQKSQKDLLDKPIENDQLTKEQKYTYICSLCTFCQNQPKLLQSFFKFIFESRFKSGSIVL